MKVVTPEISWHGREPIYSIDLQPCCNNFQRMASAGVDRVVRMWRIRVDDEGKVDVDFLANLNRHTATVNVCRFSPDGNFLASAGDDAIILLWKLSDTPTPANNIFSDEDADNKETWLVHKTLRGHLGDVYDLCWSPDSRYIVSGSIDNSAIAWDTHKDQKLALFTEHKNYVLGVAWDPLREYIATLSSDRSCRIYSLASKHCIHNVSKVVPPHSIVNAPEGTKPKAYRMYHDDTLRTFFRRLTFSPDGQLLITPAGVMETSEKQISATFVFTRGSFKEPASYLPSPNKATVAVRVCPCLFELRKIPRENGSEQVDESAKEWEKFSTVFSLPYRMVFAVATEDSVVLYDSQQTMPFGYLSNIHYHTLSDLTWSKDGRILFVASTDGYCSAITFEEGELGVPYIPQPSCSEEEVKNPQNLQTGGSSKPAQKPSSLSSEKQSSSTSCVVEKMEVDEPQQPSSQQKSLQGEQAEPAKFTEQSRSECLQTKSDSGTAVPLSMENVADLTGKEPMKGTEIIGETLAENKTNLPAQPEVKQPKRIQLTTLSLLNNK